MLATFSKLSLNTMSFTEAKAKSYLNLSRSCSPPCKLSILLRSQFLRIGSPNWPKLSTLNQWLLGSFLIKLSLWPPNSNSGIVKCRTCNNLNNRCRSRLHSRCISRCHSKCHSRCNSRCHCYRTMFSTRCKLNTRPHLSRAPLPDHSVFHYCKE